MLEGDLRARLREVSADGFDVVFDPVGGDQFEVLARSLAWEGRLLVIGFASGPYRRSLPTSPCSKGRRWWGFLGSFTAREPDRNRTLFDRLFDWVRARNCDPTSRRSFLWSMGADALNAMAERRLLGKAVLQVR